MGTCVSIYFLCTSPSAPSGGVMRIYHYVELLNAEGYDAFVVHAYPSYRPHWFDSTAQVWPHRKLQITGADVVIIPEYLLEKTSILPSWARKVILDLNPLSRPPGRLHDAAQAECMMVVSEYAQNLLGFMFPDTRVERVPHAVDRDVFSPDETEGKEFRISYMPRRRGDAIESVISALRRRGTLDAWEVISMSGMDQSEVADMMRRSRIFLSGSSREGLGRPPLEAIACGCHVVGFSGVAGREYFDVEAAHEVREDDLLDYGQTLEKILACYESDSDQYDWVGTKSAREVLRRYTVEEEKVALLTVFESLTQGSNKIVAASTSIDLTGLSTKRSRVARLAEHFGLR